MPMITRSVSKQQSALRAHRQTPPRHSNLAIDDVDDSLASNIAQLSISPVPQIHVHRLNRAQLSSPTRSTEPTSTSSTSTSLYAPRPYTPEPEFPSPRIIYTYGRNSPRRRRSLHETEGPKILSSCREAPLSACYTSVANSCNASSDQPQALRECTEVGRDAHPFTFSADVENLQAQFDQITHIFEDGAICKICLELMDKPFTLACGHSFCGPCLRQLFRLQLRKKLTSLGILSDIPSDRASFRAISRRVRLEGRQPAAFFTYSCPTCHHHSGSLPMSSRGYAALILQMRIILNQSVTSTSSSTNSPTIDLDTTMFNGLFIQS